MQKAWFAIAALILVVVTAMRSPLAPPLTNDDGAHYMLHAEAILDGRAYSDVSYLYSAYGWSIGPPLQPPGLVFTLVPGVALFGRSVLFARIVMLVSFAVFIVLVALYFTRISTSWLGVGTAMVVGTAVLATDGLWRVGSDMGLCAFAWAAVLVADSENEWTWRRVALLCVLGAVALSYRVAGAPLLPALACFAIVRYRRVGLKTLTPLLVWGLAFGFLFFVVKAGRMPGGAAHAAGAAADVAADVGAGESLIRGVIGSAWNYRYIVFDGWLYPFNWHAANGLYHVLAIALSAIGFVAWAVKSRLSLGVLFTVFYVGMILVVSVYDGRYLFPVYPAIAFSMLYGFHLLVERFGSGLSERARTMAPGVLAAMLVVFTAFTTRMRTLPVSEWVPSEWQQIASGIRARAEGRTVHLASLNPRLAIWETGFPTMPLVWPDGGDDVALNELRDKQITHVVLSETEWSAALMQYWRGLVSEHPDQFRPLFELADKHVIYEFEP